MMDKPDIYVMFHGFLKRKGLYMTSSREKVAARALLQSEPFEAHQLWNRLSGDRVGMATVYRTLDLLVDSGLVRRMPADVAKYEVVYNRPSHEYFRCQSCGRWIAFASEMVDGELADIADRVGFTIHTCHLVVEGRCHQCTQAFDSQPAGQ